MARKHRYFLMTDLRYQYPNIPIYEKITFCRWDLLLRDTTQSNINPINDHGLTHDLEIL